MTQIERLSKKNLRQILKGQIETSTPVLFVVKFYSNECHYCHALQDDFIKLSTKHDDAYFYAFNINDQPGIQKIIGFKGIPTICTFLIGSTKPRIRVMADPTTPHKQKWYHIANIDSFINTEKTKI